MLAQEVTCRHSGECGRAKHATPSYYKTTDFSEVLGEIPSMRLFMYFWSHALRSGFNGSRTASQSNGEEQHHTSSCCHGFSPADASTKKHPILRLRPISRGPSLGDEAFHDLTEIAKSIRHKAETQPEKTCDTWLYECNLRLAAMECSFFSTCDARACIHFVVSQTASELEFLLSFACSFAEVHSRFPLFVGLSTHVPIMFSFDVMYVI